MSSKDYSDEVDYYTQGFEREGFVSIWIGVLGNEVDQNADVLQDLCGVGYYRIDDQESNCFDFETVSIEKLLSDLSYSSSFLAQAIQSANIKGVKEAKWVTVQYDFDYKPQQIRRKIASDPIFIGSFRYITVD